MKNQNSGKVTLCKGELKASQKSWKTDNYFNSFGVFFFRTQRVIVNNFLSAYFAFVFQNAPTWEN